VRTKIKKSAEKNNLLRLNHFLNIFLAEKEKFLFF